MDALTVERAAPESAAHLIEAHDAFSASQGPDESRHNLTLEKMGGLRFWVVRRGGEVVGCGATKPLGDGTEEIKSMHVAEAARGRGIAAALLTRIIDDARARGLTALLLETGSVEAFAPARALYLRRGFLERGPFGDYRHDPLSTFMVLALIEGGRTGG